jgi:hypothetical protein
MSSWILTAFRATSWNKRNIVLVIDELGDLDSVEDTIRNQFLRTLRHYKQMQKSYATHSIIACGTFSTLKLSSTPIRYAPFNVANYVQVPYFTKEQTLQLSNEFADDWGINIDTSVVHDIWMNSNGCVLNFIVTASFLGLTVSFQASRHGGLVRTRYFGESPILQRG